MNYLNNLVTAIIIIFGIILVMVSLYKCMKNTTRLNISNFLTGLGYILIGFIQIYINNI